MSRIFPVVLVTARKTWDISKGEQNPLSLKCLLVLRTSQLVLFYFLGGHTLSISNDHLFFCLSSILISFLFLISFSRKVTTLNLI